MVSSRTRSIDAIIQWRHPKWDAPRADRGTEIWIVAHPTARGAGPAWRDLVAPAPAAGEAGGQRMRGLRVSLNVANPKETNIEGLSPNARQRRRCGRPVPSMSPMIRQPSGGDYCGVGAEIVRIGNSVAIPVEERPGAPVSAERPDVRTRGRAVLATVVFAVGVWPGLGARGRLSTPTQFDGPALGNRACAREPDWLRIAMTPASFMVPADAGSAWSKADARAHRR
jgi:hypothetical protein